MCVRVICARMRIVRSLPLRAVARSCWRRALLGGRAQSKQTMLRIVLLFPRVCSLSFFFLRIENVCFFAILAFLEFLTFSRWVSSLKKRFKNHDSQTASPANHEMESFGLSWLLADGTTKASIPLGDVRVDLLDACPEYSHVHSPEDTHSQHIIIIVIIINIIIIIHKLHPHPEPHPHHHHQIRAIPTSQTTSTPHPHPHSHHNHITSTTHPHSHPLPPQHVPSSNQRRQF